MKTPGAISDLALERYALGESDPGEAAAIAEALEKDPSLRAELAALEAADRDFLARFAPETMVPAIEARARSEAAREKDRSEERRFGWAPKVLRLPAAIAAVLLVAFLVYPRLGPSGDTRMKGSPHLLLFRQTSQGAERLPANASAQPHDVLQVAYEAGGAAYGTIFSVDGRGTLTFHLPPAPGGARSPSLDAKGAILLPSAYELDDAPGFERFFLVVGDRPFDLGPVEKAAAALAAKPATAQSESLRLPAKLRWVSFTIIKRSQQ